MLASWPLCHQTSTKLTEAGLAEECVQDRPGVTACNTECADIMAVGDLGRVLAAYSSNTRKTQIMDGLSTSFGKVQDKMEKNESESK